MTGEIGVQSFTYRQLSLPDLASELKPIDVSAIELYDGHLSPDSTETERADAVATLEDAGVTPCGYGVATIEGLETAEAAIGFASDLGVPYVSAHVDPDDEAAMEAVIDVAECEGIDVALHNHGPGAMYESVTDVRSVLDRWPTERLGACIDTGHYLRVDEGVERVFGAVGDRVHAVHLKDFVGPDEEAVPGDGNVDVERFVAQLSAVGFDRPPVIEYELDPDDPTPAVTTVTERLREAGF